MQKSYQANAPRNDQMNEQTTHEQKGDQLTRVTVAQLPFSQNNLQKHKNKPLLKAI